MREKARGDEKSLSQFVLEIEKVNGKQSLVGFHFGEDRVFLKVISSREVDRYLKFIIDLCFYAISYPRNSKNSGRGICICGQSVEMYEF